MPSENRAPGRNRNVQRVLVYIFFHLDAGAKADFFHGEERVDQRKFFFERDCGFFAETERAA